MSENTRIVTQSTPIRSILSDQLDHRLMQFMPSCAEGLVLRNVQIGNRRTSIRLEPDVWAALEMMCSMEDITINQLCRFIDKCRGKQKFTHAVRSFTLNYYRFHARSYLSVEK